MAHTIDGNLSDWQATDYAGAGSPGSALYGTLEPDKYVFALQSTNAIGSGTTFWLNTDRDATTGRQAFGGSRELDGGLAWSI
jgi:hypothetical protein